MSIFYIKIAFCGFSPYPNPFLEYQRIVNLPLHQGEEQLDTELSCRAVPFILRFVGVVEGKRELGVGGGGEISRSLITERMIFHILFML